MMVGKPLPPVPFQWQGPQKVSGKIGEAFGKWSADPRLAGALVGFCVLDERGDTLFASPLAETALCPASSLKTVTTGAALDLLGPDFRFETILNGSAPIGPDGILNGNLILVGGGDPTLSSGDLDQLAADAVKAGLKQVSGKVLADAAVFPAQPANDHWNWGDIGNVYGAGAFGVNLDHNRLLIHFKPGAKEGEPATIAGSIPATKEIQWKNHVSTGPAGSGDRVTVYSEPYGDVITLHGTVPAGEEEFDVTGAIPDPPAMAAGLLKASLEKAGVRVLGAERKLSGDPVKLAEHRSAPLPEIIDHLHFVSDNLEAQCLFLTMGRLQKRDPAASLKAHWESKGIAFTGLRLIDGSGLARAAMIRPLDLARVNHAIRKGPHGERFRQSLKSYVNGSVRAKLGAMSGVRTEVGFLASGDGRELTFALMANGLDPGVDFWSLREGLLEAVKSARE